MDCKERIGIKPLSVNDCYKGRRFRTKDYDNYERTLMFLLPKIEMPEPPYAIYLEFGFSSKASDWDNCIKNFQDCLQKKYDFNDKEIYTGFVKKKIVPKGQEYVTFQIITDTDI